MRTFTGTIKTDVQGSEVEFEFEVDDNATAEQIVGACGSDNLFQ